ncbi:hypothetical protein LTR78_005515 [Recurvomyces mirabilis]|uniref:Copper acquisition factor BIM1-like domain-containing protein n=1 Tax=Recurvomyces mirabilis TaxID=574656 RepID=A0AAE1C188_9PEZI|nr:hypothetical protein LTR78_005515 [Recurvomyces mirabilis]KAK5158494.1 hypothetical protein LTS14_003513 [Recurvomyces mirabilis]
MAANTLLLLSFLTLSSAHFILHWPPTAGFIDDSEPTLPCGGAVVTVNSSSPEIQINQFAIQVQNTHPQGQWQIRATTDTQEPYNFTTIVPIVNTTGIGDFCLNFMSAPAGFAGKGGVIQVIDNSADGFLYQCAPVNFIIGSNTTLGPTCSNATGFSAVFTNQQSFQDAADPSASASMPASSGTMTSMPGMTSATASSAPSGAASAAASSSSAAGAMVTGVSEVLGGLGLLMAGLVL